MAHSFWSDGGAGCQCLHAHIHNLETRFCGVANDLERLKYVVKEHNVQSAPEIRDLQPHRRSSRSIHPNDSLLMLPRIDWYLHRTITCFKKISKHKLCMGATLLTMHATVCWTLKHSYISCRFGATPAKNPNRSTASLHHLSWFPIYLNEFRYNNM